MTQFDTDYSLENAPDTWGEAAGEVDTDSLPLRRKRVMPRIPTREAPDLLTATVFSGVLAVVVGYFWYSHEVSTVTQIPWVAPILGLLLALAVRIGAGGHHPDVRATLTSVIYLISVLAVAYLVERHRFVDLYGTSDDFWAGDTNLVRNRLTQPETLALWTVGLLIAIQTSYVFQKRQPR